MANYIVILKYSGKLDFPQNQQQAKAEIQQLLLPRVMHNEFELQRIEPWTVSTEPAGSYTAEGDCVILEIKLRLGDNEVRSRDKILERITTRLQRGNFFSERIAIKQDQEHFQSLITFSELNRHHRYLVNFHYPDTLEAIAGGGDDTAIVKEVQMLMHCGEMALGDYAVIREEGHEQRCDTKEIKNNETTVEVNVMINEFNIDFQDSDSVYHYVLGEVDACGCQLSYRYDCKSAEHVATHIGLTVYCSYKALELDDYQDLIQQL
jgi:hypothetical protein